LLVLTHSFCAIVLRLQGKKKRKKRRKMTGTGAPTKLSISKPE
jgi:hypothetical protein